MSTPVSTGASSLESDPCSARPIAAATDSFARYLTASWTWGSWVVWTRQSIIHGKIDETPRWVVTGSAALQKFTHHPRLAGGSFRVARSPSTCRFVLARGLPMVTSPTTSMSGGSRRTRSAAMTDPRLWPTMTSRPALGRRVRIRRRTYARTLGLSR
ncbi:hypothetical protein SDC9_113872 [bioreactor metagenome]|uniref:Uncharacterized protein n=1 Tax=bioreactor metagenome TaxID=1076179 RepID=A0A645BPA4_9ZZZZ